MNIPRSPAAVCLLLAVLAAGCDSGSVTGPALTPYEAASALKGGISYDNFWNAGSGFDQTQPLIATFNARGDFFRCKQCHGWDRLGTAASYINRRPSTSRPNISAFDLAAFSRTSTPQQIFDAIKTGSGATRRAATVNLSTYDPAVDATVGDQMPDYAAFMSDTQIWDLVRFLKDDALDVTLLYDVSVTGAYPTGTIAYSNFGRDGNAAAGQTIFSAQCQFCHGANGKAIVLEGLSLGAFTRSKPAEVQHKVRYGQLGSIMRATSLTPLQTKNLYKLLADTLLFPR